ncbi:hypothetical protein HYU95_05500 [Candidatus Daviesbacteria bacterium]|nr:hypothetical protein [Candidatus Daviesbacteria bacterium]
MQIESVLLPSEPVSIFRAAISRMVKRHGFESKTPRQFLLPVTASALSWLDKKFGMLNLPLGKQGKQGGRFGEELELLSVMGRYCLIGYFVLPPTLLIDAFCITGRCMGYTKDILDERRVQGKSF